MSPKFFDETLHQFLLAFGFGSGAILVMVAALLLMRDRVIDGLHRRHP